MKKLLILAMVLLALLIALPVRADLGTLYVDDDGVCDGNTPCHTSIQAAVNAATSSETVYVYAGIYYEHVTIDKPLALLGEDRETTIIDGSGSGNVLYVTANYVTVGGVTVRNGYDGINLIPNWSIHHFTFRDAIVTANERAGIFAQHSNSVGAYHLLEDCVISNNGWNGLYAHQFNRSVIQNCEVFGNHNYALDPAWGSYTLITGNRVHDNEGAGIHLDSMYYTTVENNESWNNSGAGISTGYANGYNTIRENIVRHNGTGISMGTPGNRVYHNDLIENAVQAGGISANFWDNGYPSGGNYWSDYTGVDNYSGSSQDQPGSDGIGDTPYAFYGNQDHYPLMNPWNAQPPVADGGGPYTADEGDTITFDASGSSDPDDNIVSYEWDLDNDGEYDDATGVTTEVVFDDDGAFTVGLRVTDEFDESDTDTAEVAVLNVAPAVNAGSDATIYSGETFTVNASFTDPGVLDTHTATIDFRTGDGPEWATVVEEEGSGTVTGSHRYFVPDTYTVEVCVTDDDEGTGCDSLSLEVKPFPVTIDIKPCSYPNSINLKSKGVVPVAVLTTDDFDASTVDPVTVEFADASPLRWATEDVDGDGDVDLLFHFKTQELNLDENSTEATLTGDTTDGKHIKGTDTVNIVPKGK